MSMANYLQKIGLLNADSPTWNELACSKKIKVYTYVYCSSPSCIGKSHSKKGKLVQTVAGRPLIVRCPICCSSHHHYTEIVQED